MVLGVPSGMDTRLHGNTLVWIESKEKCTFYRLGKIQIYIFELKMFTFLLLYKSVLWTELVPIGSTHFVEVY